MKNLLDKIRTGFEAFLKDATAQVENVNKAAGTRARRASFTIEKALKEYRKKSIEAST